MFPETEDADSTWQGRQICGLSNVDGVCMKQLSVLLSMHFFPACL